MPLSGALGAAALTVYSAGNLTLAMPNEATFVNLNLGLPSGATAMLDCAACGSLPVGVSVARILITAEDRVHVANITLLLDRARSTDCSLSGLRLFT